MTRQNVIIVEDQHALAVALAAAVRQAGGTSELAPTAAQARVLLASGECFHAMILDIGLPDANGLEFLGTLAEEQRPPTIVVTAHGEIQNTIEARKLGVIDFLTKPLDFNAFQKSLRRVLQTRSPSEKPTVREPEEFAFIGAAATMRPVFRQIAHSCASDDPVLVRGETGTGKSHVARLIQSNRTRRGPAGSLVVGPATTIDELEGALDETAGGVLVIEDVGHLALEVQSALVRRIERGNGSEFPRLIATSGDDLHALVSEQNFRSDLFYRLQVLEVRLPPLRERMEDLPALMSFFVGQLMPDRVLDVTDAALRRLAAHDWPGNLLELRNLAAYASTVNAGSPVIDESDLPPYLGAGPSPVRGGPPVELVQALDSWLDERLEAEELPVYRDLADSLEAELIRQLLKRYDGKLARLASALKANRTTLRKRLNEGS